MSRVTPAGGRTNSVRIGYLPFYVDYYEGVCADFPREKAAVAQRGARTLSQFGQVIWDGQLINNADEAAKAGAALARQNPDVIVVLTTIAVFGGIPLVALRALTQPILIWNAQQIRTVGRGYSMVEIVRNTGQIGTQALANTLLREGRWFRVVTGHESNRRMHDALRRNLSVIATAAAMKKARLLAVGDGFPLMTDIEMDEHHLCQHVGASITTISSQRLTEVFQNIDPQRVAEQRREATRSNRVRELDDDAFDRSLRLSAALDDLACEHHADGGSVNCHGGNCLRNPAIGITACYSLGVQNARGRPFTCTGDLPTALAMLMLKKLTGVSMYTEVQVMDEKRRAVVIANSGEGEDGIRRKSSPALIRGNTNFAGVHRRGASFAYPLKTGPATLASLTPTPRGPRPFRLIVAEGTILADRLPDAGSLAGFFRFARGELHDAYTRWLEAGPVHHAATTVGHWSRELRDVAQLLRFEFVEV